MSSGSQPMTDPSPAPPYLTVGLDQRSGTCWLVVARDITLVCHSGSRAMELLRALCKSKGLPPPQ